METWTVYILRCSDGSIYTGCTSDFLQRIDAHNQGYVNYTKSRRPLVPVAWFVFNSKYKAFDFEKYLKTGSGIAFSRRHFL